MKQFKLDTDLTTPRPELPQLLSVAIAQRYRRSRFDLGIAETDLIHSESVTAVGGNKGQEASRGREFDVDDLQTVIPPQVPVLGDVLAVDENPSVGTTRTGGAEVTEFCCKP